MSSPDAEATHLAEQLAGFRTAFAEMRREIASVIVGQQEIVDGALTALVAGGHVLLEGVPGLGKTLLVRTIADVLALSFKRIQFTPDLMPADVIGTNVIAEGTDGHRHFEFQPGPVFAHIVLADEINRSTPKTQSALLEAMQERSVTVAGKTHTLPRPFFVLATQNPIEQQGTYPLPEAQLDRFMFKLLVKFPAAAELNAILGRTTDVDEVRARPVMTGDKLLELSRLIRQIPAPAETRAYCCALVMATHPDQPLAPDVTRRYVRFGASPRAAQALLLTAKVRAALDGRFHVAREDVRAVAHPAAAPAYPQLRGAGRGVSPDSIIDRVLEGLTRPSAGSAYDETVTRVRRPVIRRGLVGRPRRPAAPRVFRPRRSARIAQSDWVSRLPSASAPTS